MPFTSRSSSASTQFGSSVSSSELTGSVTSVSTVSPIASTGSETCVSTAVSSALVSCAEGSVSCVSATAKGSVPAVSGSSAAAAPISPVSGMTLISMAKSRIRETILAMRLLFILYPPCMIWLCAAFAAAKKHDPLFRTVLSSSMDIDLLLPGYLIAPQREQTSDAGLSTCQTSWAS